MGRTQAGWEPPVNAAGSPRSSADRAIGLQALVVSTAIVMQQKIDELL